MVPIVFHIMLPGVTLELPGTWESKHHPRELVDEVGARLADSLGGVLLYWEERGNLQ